MTLRILFFGRYDADYSRNAVLMRGLVLNGVQVEECRVSPSARFWAVQLLWNYLRMRPRFDAMVIAFPGQEAMLLARWLTRKPILFDAFTSHVEGYVEDRRVVAPNSLRARYYFVLDWLACRLATACITDTAEHAKYWRERFGVPMQRMHVVYLGTLLESMPNDPVGRPFTVHFHGSNIPLQGIDVIWSAVRRLWNEDILFRMIGPFVVPHELREKVQHIERVPFSELSGYLAKADVALGIFGTSAKAMRVIPNKVYEGIASKLPVITADTPAIRELFDEASAVLIPQGNADELAQAISSLKANPARRAANARAALDALQLHATPAIVGRGIIDICERLSLRT